MVLTHLFTLTKGADYLYPNKAKLGAEHRSCTDTLSLEN